ncbi:MAG: DUF1853 family protein [Myxococcota bacterium]
MSRRLGDLAWTIGSPPICAPNPRWASAAQSRHELAEHRAWLEQLEPDELDAFVNVSGTRRLGLYFETLHAFWFARSPHRTLLADHVPIRRGAQTLGELDFVYDDGSGPVHCEIAVKFYLRVQAATGGFGLAGYVGPSLRDRFDWKLNKIANAQSRRIELPETRDALVALGIEPGRVRTEIRLKGVLFEPAGSETPRPDPVDAECLTGEWMTLGEWVESSPPEQEWHILDRLEWLYGPGPERPALSVAATRTLLERHRRPVQLCQTSDGAIERRVFIVPDGWSAQAREVAASSPNRALGLRW